MPTKTFKIYSSSAGSGKTYTLSRTYLQLVIKNPSLYKSILAVTFTNKAAWEMKSRIMQYLFQLSSGMDCPVLADLISETGFNEEKIRENASMALANVLHNYPLFSIKTIDSFFQSIVQAFSRELGLQGGFEIELDQEKVLDNLVDRVMMDVGTNNSLTQWLIRFAENRVDEGKSWDIKEDIKKLAWEIFNENFKSFEADIQQNGHVVPELQKKLGQITASFEQELKGLGKEALRLIRDHGLQVGHFSYGKTGVMGYLEKLSTGTVSVPGARMHNALSSPESLYRKGDPNKVAIVNVYESGLCTLIQQVLSLFQEDYPYYTTAIAISRYIYTLGILSDISLKLRAYREENQVLLISDLADFLRKIISENDVPFVYEKTGARYRNFMVDEFQDTSAFQWENIKPLIKNSLAEGHMNLVVGDVKQSIYRWRGGNWELLLRHIYDGIFPETIEKLTLDTNYRSKILLVRFFNSLFSSGPPIIKSHFLNVLSSVTSPLRETILPEAEKILTAYEDALQLFPESRKDEGDQGYVRIGFFEGNGDASWRDQAMESIPGILENIQDSGCAIRDVAFLVRNNKEGESVINFLMQYKSSGKAKNGYSYDVISSESLFLSSAHSVNILLQALKYLHKPEDEIALFNLVFEYQLYIEKNTDFTDPDVITRCRELDFVTGNMLLPQEFFDRRSQFTSLPLFELAEALIRSLSLTRLKGEWPFIQGFLDQVLAFTQKERGEIDRFLEWWDKSGKNSSIQMPDDMDAAKILTIHKSKGLQFKAVILPFFDWELDHNPLFDNIIWCKSDKQPFNMLERLPVRYTSALSDTLFSREYFTEKINCAIDNLNLLYVAVTRARDQLNILGRLPVANNKGEMPFKSVSDLLYRVISFYNASETVSQYKFLDLNEHWNLENAVFEAGSCIGKKPLVKDQEGKSSLGCFVSSDWREKISIKFASTEYGGSLGIRGEKMKFGKLVHGILAKAEIYSDLPRILKEYYYEGIIDSGELKLLEEMLNSVFKNEQLREWFSGRHKIKNEAMVMQPGGKISRPDRVMIDGDNAVALDFKTGKRNDSDQKQVREYMLLLKEMGFKKVDGYLLYLDDMEIVKVDKL